VTAFVNDVDVCYKKRSAVAEKLPTIRREDNVLIRNKYQCTIDQELTDAAA